MRSSSGWCGSSWNDSGRRSSSGLASAASRRRLRGRPGTAERQARPETGAPNVARAGAWTATGWPATMESAVRSGRAAARLVQSTERARVTTAPRTAPAAASRLREAPGGPPWSPPCVERSSQKRACVARPEPEGRGASRIRRDRPGTPMTVSRDPARHAARAEETLEAPSRASSSFNDGGWWVGELESNVTMTAQHLFLLEFLRLRDEATTRKLVNELRAPAARRRHLGDLLGGRAQPAPRRSRAYAALRMAGFDADDTRLAGARRFVEDPAAAVGRLAGLHADLALTVRALVVGTRSRSFRPSSAHAPGDADLGLQLLCWARQTIVRAHRRHALPAGPPPTTRAALP